jgi:methionyl aminopeptidase
VHDLIRAKLAAKRFEDEDPAVIHRKTPEEIEEDGRRRPGAGALPRDPQEEGPPGRDHVELDDAAERFIRSQGAEPAFKGYRGFPGSICASPNSMVVHGIPGSYRLQRGDLLSVDIGVVLDGWVADAAITHPIGNVTPVAKRLLATTKASLFDAVEQCVPGNRLGDVSHAVRRASRRRLQRDSLAGGPWNRPCHARGPADPNFGRPGTGPGARGGNGARDRAMVNVGTHHVRMGSDNWAVYSEDGSLAAHFEHTVAITGDGPRILTPWHLSEAEPLQAATLSGRR